MNTIYIGVDKDHPEDDILDLLETLKKMFGKDHIQVQDTLAISSDLPQVMALIKSIPTNGNVAGGVNVASGKYAKPKKFQCIECGEPVVREGTRCKTCAMRLVGKKNAARRNGGIRVENEADLEALLILG